MADPVSIFTPQMQQQLAQLLQSQVDRSTQTSPIHQAAMAMATRMAPAYARNAMTAPTTMPSGPLLAPTGSSSGAPGLGMTATAAAFAALLKSNSPLAAMLKQLMGGGAPGGGVPIPGGEFDPNATYGGGDPGLGTSFPFGGGGGGGDPTQPGGAQGQGVGIGLPFFSAYGGSGSPPTGQSGQQGSSRPGFDAL